MNNRVKEFFNKTSDDEAKYPKINKKRRYLGYIPTINHNVADINDFTHFIECDISPTICPMQWEDLEIDFEDKDKRFCEYCGKFVYKADNEFMVDKLISENKCMAVSNQLIEKINGKIDEQRLKNLEDRLRVSKLFLVFKKYEPSAFEEFQKQSLTQEELLKQCILYMFDRNYEVIEKYTNMGVDMQFIIEKIVPKIDDDKFQEFIKQKLDIKSE